MPDNNKKFDNGQTLERQLPLADSIFQSKAGTSDNSHKIKNSFIRKSPNNNSGSVLSVDGIDFLGNIQTYVSSIFKAQEMATVKLGWMLLNCIGFPVYIYAWVLAVVNGDEIKAWILFLFGVAFMIIEGLRRYEGYRSRKIDNDERIYLNKKSHKKDEQNSQP